MSIYFGVYNDSAIFDRALEFLVTFIWTETRFYVRFERPLVVKTTSPSIVNNTMLYLIDDVMIIKLSTK